LINENASPKKNNKNTLNPMEINKNHLKSLKGAKRTKENIITSAIAVQNAITMERSNLARFFWSNFRRLVS
jgi:hypothetical protein